MNIQKTEYTSFLELVITSLIMHSHVPLYEADIIPALGISVSTGSRASPSSSKNIASSLLLSGHYHMHHEFQIGKTRCVVVPAIVYGFSSIFSFDPSTMELSVEIQKF